jgi:rod shape-determining protein MreC
MPLGTLDRAPPPFFRQGPSALSKLFFFSALALFLMVADTRFRITQPVRTAIAIVLQPVQWFAYQPILLAKNVGGHFTALASAQSTENAVRRQLAEQSLRAVQVEQLHLENVRLRALLDLRQTLPPLAQAAEVLYDAADIYSRKVILDKGTTHRVELGSAVMDESGVLGQVTRVYPLVSEVTLVVDRDQAIPVLNTRTGARSVAFGDPAFDGGGLELRFMAANADVLAGDLLTTSGVDGVYPAGLPVAKVAKVERRADTAFARIYCTPAAAIGAARHVMVIPPVSAQIAPRPEASAVPVTGGKKPTLKASSPAPEAAP